MLLEMVDFRPLESQTAAIRFGHGLSPRHALPRSTGAMLETLAGPDRMVQQWPTVEEGQAAEMIGRFGESIKASRSGRPEDVEAYKQVRRDIGLYTRRSAVARMARILDAPDTFRERLHQFWCDHFTTVPKVISQAALQMDHQDRAIRPAMTGPFRRLLREAVTHRMMLDYLEQSSSKGPNSANARKNGGGVNENLAREVLELHTLGVGGAYGQQDVAQFALLLTGLGQQRDGTTFRPGWAEPGAETVLGRSYGGDPARLSHVLAALDDLAEHPQTARHIARKLAVHFISDTPPEDLVEAMAAAYRDNATALMPLYRVMLEHPAALAPAQVKARQPLDWMTAALRSLGVPGERIVAMRDHERRRLLIGPLMRMGQPWQRPIGPDGWPEEAADWLTPAGLAERIDWSLEVPGRIARLPDARRLAEQVCSDATRADMVALVGRAERQAEGVALVLASPEMNTR